MFALYTVDAKAEYVKLSQEFKALGSPFMGSIDHGMKMVGYTRISKSPSVILRVSKMSNESKVWWQRKGKRIFKKPVMPWPYAAEVAGLPEDKYSITDVIFGTSLEDIAIPCELLIGRIARGEFGEIES